MVNCMYTNIENLYQIQINNKVHLLKIYKNRYLYLQSGDLGFNKIHTYLN